MGLVDYASDSESESAPALDKRHGKRPEPDEGGDSGQEQVTTKRCVVSPSTLLLCSGLVCHPAIADESAEDGRYRVFPARLLRVSTSIMSPGIQHEESHPHLKIGSRVDAAGRESMRAMLM